MAARNGVVERAGARRANEDALQLGDPADALDRAPLALGARRVERELPLAVVVVIHNVLLHRHALEFGCTYRQQQGLLHTAGRRWRAQRVERMNGLFDKRGIAFAGAAAVAAASAYYFMVYKSNKESAGRVQANSAGDYVIKVPKTVDPDVTSKAKLRQIMDNLDKRHPKLLKRAFFESRMFNPVAVRLLQFNMLAEGLSAEPDFGGFTQTPVDSLDFHKFRKFRLLEELLRYNADIIAIEECDHFDDFFLPALKLHGYDGRFFPKRNASTLNFGADTYSHGVAPE